MWHFYHGSTYTYTLITILHTYTPFTPHHQHGMLVNRPSAFIFQQIILPYLASTPRIPNHQQRYFSSSSPATRPEVREREGSNTGTWDLYPASGSRARTRGYLGLDVDELNGSRGVRDRAEGESSKAGRVNVEEEEEAYKRTAALAMERIIQSHQPLSSGKGLRSGVRVKPSDKGKGRALDHPTNAEIEPNLALGLGPVRADDAYESNDDLDANVYLDHETIANDTNKETTTLISTKTTSPTTQSRQRPFPPLIYQLLQARQFRLAALHIFNLPLYALDTVLVENVAGFMDRHNGGRIAARLRRGKTPTPESKRLMSDHDEYQEGQGRLPLPDNYWSLTRSSRTPPRTLDDMDKFMPGIELSRNQKFTAFCNIQLAHLLANHPSSGKGVLPPKSFKRPNTSLRQLRSLLTRIHRLETHRGFIPDRVTANIILSSWLRCSLSPPPTGQRINHGKSGWKISIKHQPNSQPFGKTELRGLFDTISKLIDRSILSRDQSLNHARHVKPFVRMLSRCFGDLGDVKGLEKVKEWEKVVKRVLLERQASGSSMPTVSEEEAQGGKDN